MSVYLDEKLFASIFIEKYLNLESVPREERPMERLAALEAKGPKSAAKALAEAISDLLVMAAQFSPEEVAEFEQVLKDSGAPSLADMRIKYSKRYRALIQKRVISNDRDFYFLKNVADSADLSEEDKSKVLALISKYERT